MAWQRRAKKEIAEGWKWMRQQDPEAVKEAERWVEENSEEMREVDRILYRSDEQFYGKIHTEAPHSIADGKKYVDPDAALSQSERDRIYEDHTRIPNEFYREDSDDEDTIRLPKELAEGLQELTDLQREVVFRNVVNGESASVIADEKNCSARNIRDVRARALRALRDAMTKGLPGYGCPDTVLYTLWSILIAAAVYILLVPDAVEAWMRYIVFIMLPIVTVAAVWMIVHQLHNSPAKRLRDYWRRKK